MESAKEKAFAQLNICQENFHSSLKIHEYHEIFLSLIPFVVHGMLETEVRISIKLQDFIHIFTIPLVLYIPCLFWVSAESLYLCTCKIKCVSYVCFPKSHPTPITSRDTLQIGV